MAYILLFYHGANNKIHFFVGLLKHMTSIYLGRAPRGKCLDLMGAFRLGLRGVDDYLIFTWTHPKLHLDQSDTADHLDMVIEIPYGKQRLLRSFLSPVQILNRVAVSLLN